MKLTARFVPKLLVLFILSVFFINEHVQAKTVHTSVGSALSEIMKLAGDNCYDFQNLQDKTFKVKLNKTNEGRVKTFKIIPSGPFGIVNKGFNKDGSANFLIRINNPHLLIEKDDPFCFSRDIKFEHSIITESAFDSNSISSNVESSCRVDLAFKHKNRPYEMDKISKNYSIKRTVSKNLKIIENTKNGFSVKRLDNKPAWAKLVLTSKKYPNRKPIVAKTEQIDKCAKYEVKKKVIAKKPSKVLHVDDFVMHDNIDPDLIELSLFENCLCMDCNDDTPKGYIKFEGIVASDIVNLSKEHDVKCKVKWNYHEGHALSDKNDFTFHGYGYFQQTCPNCSNERIENRNAGVWVNIFDQNSFNLTIPSNKDYRLGMELISKVPATRHYRRYWKRVGGGFRERLDLLPKREYDCVWASNGKKTLEVNENKSKKKKVLTDKEKKHNKLMDKFRNKMSEIKEARTISKTDTDEFNLKKIKRNWSFFEKKYLDSNKDWKTYEVFLWNEAWGIENKYDYVLRQELGQLEGLEMVENNVGLDEATSCEWYKYTKEKGLHYLDPDCR